MNKRKRGALPVQNSKSLSSSLQSLLVEGFALHQKGNLIAAEELYAKILNKQPLHFDALHLSGLIAAQNNKLDLALQFILNAISLNPRNASAHCNLGNVYLNLTRFELAVESYTKAISLKPNYEEAIYSRGLAYQKLNKLDLAKQDYEHSLTINPKHIGTLTNLGNVYQLQKKYDEAINFYQKSIDLGLLVAEPFNNRGNLYTEQKRYKEALLDFDRALEINPNYPEALSNKGNALYGLKRFEDALSSYNMAISLRPRYAEALHNRANLFREIRQFHMAEDDYRGALAIKPDYDYVKGNLFGTCMNLCEWNGLLDEWKSIEDQIFDLKKVISPFMTIPINDSIETQRKVAEIWVNEKHPAQQIPDFEFIKIEDRKIRIGYFSADFHDHATMYLMAQLFELHDKSRFETIGFSFGPDRQDSMRIRAITALDHFHDVRDKTDSEIAQLSRDLGVDIAVDLKGFTLDSRAGIFSYRAAPIQVNYLGYPGTMGADFMDYLIADRNVIPEELKHLYSEEVVYLPRCYQVNDQKRHISEKSYTRQELGLPELSFIFCCFNANYKITPITFDSWMNILKNVPESVLWLFEDCDQSATNLRKEAAYRGIDPQRLVFAKNLPLPEHLARYRIANLFLDTFPCNAHTTTSDALWAGLPVLTYAGQTFAARVAASLLHAVGLKELVTNNRQDYESLAIELANNPNRLDGVKKKLFENLKDAELFDSKGFTSDLENLYIHLAQKNIKTTSN
jgi:predicted O-linked N-acetylglucosamine transferase (SPINDLY family)